MITSRSDFEREIQAIDRLVDRGAKLPDQVFRRRVSAFHMFDFDQLWSAEWFCVAQRLAKAAGDPSFTFAVLRPDPEKYFYAHFGKFPLLQFTIDDPAEYFVDTIHDDPGDSAADAIAYNSDAIFTYTASQRWGIYGDREIEVGIVAAMDDEMEPAIHAAASSLRLFTAAEAVSQLLPPVYGGVVPEDVKAALIRNYSNVAE